MNGPILEALCAHMSLLNARALLSRIDATVTAETGRRPDTDALVDALLTHGALFCSQGTVDELRHKLIGLRSDPRKPLENLVIEISEENDVSRARLAARNLCEALGARRLATQQVATVVSELARNIALYTPGGKIVLEPLRGNPARIRVIAEDRGTGISNLPAILDGTYRSRTGLGKGLMGVKRLMDRFDIKTGPRGTRIEAEGAVSF